MTNWETIITPYKEALLADLQGLLKIPSVKDPETASPSAPFGEGIQKALEYMLALGQRDGFSTKDIDHYAGHLEIGHGEKLLGILSHLDVVPADATKWQTDPFTPILKDGKLFARGALDDKGPTLMAYYAVKILKEQGYHFNQRIRLIYGTDEENDWQGVTHYFKKEVMPNFGIVPDGIFPMIYAEKGVASLSFKKVVNSQQLLKFHAGQAYNVVADLASAELDFPENLQDAFETYLNENNLKGQWEKDESKQILTLYGKSAHAAGPSQGINAGLYLVHFLNQLALDQNAKEFLAIVDKYFWQDTSGKKLGIFHQDKELGDTTLNTAFITIENKQASIGINWRYPASLSFDKTWSIFKTWANQTKLDVSLISHQKPSHAKTDSPEVQTLLNTYRKLTKDQTPPLAIGGITYGRVFDRGITFGPAFLGKKATLHQPNEYIELDDLWKALVIYLEALYLLATEEGSASLKSE